MSEKLQGFKPIPRSTLPKRFFKLPKKSKIEVTSQAAQTLVIKKRDPRALELFIYIYKISNNKARRRLKRALRFTKKIQEVIFSLGEECPIVSTLESFKGPIF